LTVHEIELLFVRSGCPSCIS